MEGRENMREKHDFKVLMEIVNNQQKQIELLLEKNEDLKISLDKTTRAIEDLRKINDINQRKNDVKFWQLFNNGDATELDLRKRFFKQMPKASGVLALAQKCELVVMKIVHEVCTKNNLPYWIDYGTLIGAIRHEGFIPWDDDIDICMMREDIDKLDDLLKDHPEVELKHYYGYKPDGLIHYIRVVFRALENCFVDIFVYDYIDDDAPETINKFRGIRDDFRKRSMSFAKNMTHDQYEAEFLKSYDKLKKEIANKGTKTTLLWTTENFTKEHVLTYKYDNIFPVQQIKFENIIVNAPKEAAKQVNTYYGDIYNLPNDVGVNKHFHYNQAQLEKMEEIVKKYKI